MTMDHKLWVYWEGPRSPLLQLCLDSMERHCPTFHLIDGQQGIIDLGGQHIIDAAAGLMKPYRADLLRFWLLHKFGGVWSDADVIMVNEMPAEFWEQVPNYDVIGCFNPHTTIGMGSNGIVSTPIAARQGSPFFEICYERVLEAFKRHKEQGIHINYGSTSVGVQSSLYKHRKGEFKTLRFPHWRYNRIPWYKSDLYSLAGSRGVFEMSPLWNSNGCMYHLTNKPFPRFANKNRQQILKSYTLVGWLLQKAFGISPAIPSHTHSILNRLPLHKPLRGVEVGCLKGRNARVLLQQRPQLQLMMVDPWSEVTLESNPSFKNTKDYMTRWTQEKWNQIYKQAMLKTEFAKDRRIVLRGLSVEMSKQVEDKSLDFVFIDADHSYEGCKGDLDAWLPKVKPGGLISGHDFNHPRELKQDRTPGSIKTWGVTKAVHELRDRIGGTVVAGQYYTWFLNIN